MSDFNPYQPPKSSPEPSKKQGSAGGGSLESAVVGDYQWNVGDVLRDSIRHTQQHLLPMALATLIYLAVGWAIFLFVNHWLGDFSQAVERADQDAIRRWGLVFTVISFPLLKPLQIGLQMLAVRYLSQQKPAFWWVFFYWGGMLWRVALLAALTYAIESMGFMLIIPGIYLSIAYLFALYLLVDHKLSVWQALETSRKAVTHQWFKFFGLMLLLGLLNIAGALCLLVGLLWTLPMSYIALGIVYRKVFGTRVLEENLP